MLWIFENRFVSDPHQGVELTDELSVWQQLLDDPEVVADDEGKESASVLCGAKYFEDAHSRDREGVESVTCLVLDVDACPVPEVALRGALAGLRAVVYTSPSHTAAKPRWRVLMPLASPLAPKKHRSLVQFLSDNLVPSYPGCIDAAATGDPTRLGFVCVTKHPEDYRWWLEDGEKLNWSDIDLEDEEWVDAPLGGLERQKQWNDRPTALAFASKAYATRGYTEVKSGEHRTLVLWNAALDLWWSWAAEDEEFVMTVLREINSQFPEAKEDEEVYRKMREAHARTVGPGRKAQLIGPYGAKREPSNTISVSTIKHLAKRLRKSQKPTLANVGEEMWRVAKGETVSDDPDTWRSALARVAVQLASNFTSDRPDRIASFFVPSISTMLTAAKGVETAVPSVEMIEGWINTRLQGERKRREENASRAEDNTRKTIAAATRGKRDTKYSMEEVDAWMAPNGCGLSDKTWILVSGRGYFVFVDGAWVGPYTETEFDAQGYTDLEAASDFVRTRVFNEEKQVWSYIPVKQLIQKYGSCCQTCIDFTCEQAWFRAEDGTLVLAGPKRNPIEPRFHNDVDNWLRVMTGRASPRDDKERQEQAKKAGEEDDYDAVCNWLASLVQLDRVCAALYLQGPKSVGKGLFADGIARLWKAGKIPISAAFGHFNSLLTSSPLVHVDEGLPARMSASVLLRRTLADVEHVYTRKNVDSGKISGCVRILFTANNLDLFSQNKEKLQKDDVDALADRFVHIKVRPAAAAFLKSLGHRHHAFVSENLLAEHTLWLNEKRWPAVKARDLRFLVAGCRTDVADVVATNNDATSDVCNAIAGALCGARETDFVLVKDGEIWVNAPAVRLQVGLQNPAAKYTDRDVIQAIASVSTGHKNIRGKKKVQRMWSFRVDALRAWCENSRVFDWDEVNEGLQKMNEG